MGLVTQATCRLRPNLGIRHAAKDFPRRSLARYLLLGLVGVCDEGAHFMSVSSTALIAHAPPGPTGTVLTFVTDAAEAPQPEATGIAVP